MGNGLEQFAAKNFPQAEPIRDCFHASEHVTALAKTLLLEDEAAATAQAITECHQLKHSGGSSLLAEWERLDVGSWKLEQPAPRACQLAAAKAESSSKDPRSAGPRKNVEAPKNDADLWQSQNQLQGMHNLCLPLRALGGLGVSVFSTTSFELSAKLLAPGLIIFPKAQVSFPTARATAPTAQVAVPTTQETLNLGATLVGGVDANYRWKAG